MAKVRFLRILEKDNLDGSKLKVEVKGFFELAKKQDFLALLSFRNFKENTLILIKISEFSS